MDRIFDVVILGGGASGSTVAITAKRNNPKLNIGIIDKNDMLCRKLLVCGAGRCNITNNQIDVSRYAGGNAKFLNTIIAKYKYPQIDEFIKSLGIETYLEIKGKNPKGKIFPVTDDAKTVTKLIDHQIDKLGITKLLSIEIVDVERDGELFVIKTSSEPIIAKNLVLALGGLSYPYLGASSKGYDIAEKFGHTVVKPVPSAVPLEVDEWVCRKLSGIKIVANVQAFADTDLIGESTDDLMFTSYGLSGSSILNVSRLVSTYINRDKKNNIHLRINFFPDLNYDRLSRLLESRWESNPEDSIKISLYGLLSNKFVDIFLEYLNINPNILNKEIPKEVHRKLIQNLMHWEVKVIGTRGWNQAEFTAGGVKVNEVSFDNLESKIIPNLFVVGEMLDVDGDVGGFNLSWSWITGMIVGNYLSQKNG
jgi:predicted Rossmann fold flavoprotein